ncbi:MAG: hypothetical protein NT163_07990 [Chlorobiales bacterium]|nr:hypothetical protein [Chlorobiales bacterium]
MLSELYTLHESLRRCGIVPEKSDTWITYHKKEDGFVVGLDEEGEVKRIEYLPKQRMAEVWKAAPSNHHSFPALNLKVPVWQPSESVESIRASLKGKKGKVRVEQVKAICNASALCPHGKGQSLDQYLQNFSKRLTAFPKELDLIIRPVLDADCIVLDLLNRVQKIRNQSGQFLRQLSELAINASLDGRLDSWELVERLLLGMWDEKENNYKSFDIPIVLDVDNYSDFSFRIFDGLVKKQVNDALFQHKGVGIGQGVCALSGESGELENDKFPQPKLPILGPSYLYSMNKDAKCHTRYGRISTASYPVNKELAVELQNSLLFITANEREGKTWCSVPGSSKKERDILIAYLEKMPVNDIDFSFLGEQENMEGEFEASAKQVCEALRGNPMISADDELRIFVLKSVDKARRQVLFNSVFSVSKIINGNELWLKGATNHPLFSLTIPLKKGEKAKALAPFCPSPSAVMRFFHFQWIRNGQEKSEVHGCRLSDVFDLMFADSELSKKLCIKFLKLVLRQVHPLLIGVGGALHLGQVNRNVQYSLDKYSIESKKATLVAVSLISILLYKLGFKKEDYMNEIAFQIGRILSLVDTLHREYSKVVRDDIPNQLLGNSMMKTALDNPQRALARLNQRLLVYKAWVDKGGEEARLAKWAVGEMGKIARGLENCDLDIRLDDIGQAKMLLGYLARYENQNKGEEYATDFKE